MGQAAAPTSDDLKQYIESLGVINPTKFDDAVALMRLDVKAPAAWSDWEKRTGWKPFLKDAADVTRWFDPPGPNREGVSRGGGRLLRLEAGLLTLTSLTTHLSVSEPDGTALTVNEHFWLTDAGGDYNADAEGRPWEIVQFSSNQYGPPRSIRIIGRWGRAETIPDDAWEAVRQYGAYLAYQELSLNISRGLFSHRDLNTEIRYGGGGTAPLSLEAQRWRDDYEMAALRYERVSL
ncbi:MAG: hypothetical protein A2W00_04460 [Candidatus Eisenbacteria bacterium RBG_16_71_46]|nr:MAG: hypothetical protein A2V59_06815 [Armatimonadetes bacterium RBG_19FT_COMBO_69_19]OGF05204.1 MAG: hypothetical protein A2W00_04460 [Candidatus Eisenbacteria bacterium RBG_16_71_46]